MHRHKNQQLLCLCWAGLVLEADIEIFKVAVAAVLISVGSHSPSLHVLEETYPALREPRRIETHLPKTRTHTGG